MAKLTKKQKNWTVDSEKLHGVDEAIGLAKQYATAKFDETIEVALNLGVDPRHARPSASPSSPRAPRPMRRARPGPTSSAPRTCWRPSRAARSTSTAALPRPT
jgi:hypothetical protein